MNGNLIWQAGPFALTRFSLLIGLGALLWWLTALWMRAVRCRRSLNAGQVSFAALWMLVLGVVCSRALYCVVNYDRYVLAEGGGAQAARLWEGGTSLCGALLGAMLGLAVAARLSGARTGRLANCFAPGWGLFTLCAAFALRQTGEGWGKLIEMERLTGTPLVLQDRYGDWRFAVYRMDAALGALVFVTAAARMSVGKRPASWNVCAWAVGLWAAGRIVTASAREGDLLRVEYFRIEQIGAMVALIAILIARIAADRRAGAGGKRFGWIVPFAVGAGIATAMEFAVDREGGLEWKYCAMLAGAALCLVAALAPGSARRLRRMRRG